MKKCTVFITTDQGYWGYSDTIEKALVKANFRAGQKIVIQILNTPPENLTWDNMKGLISKDGLEYDCYEITDKPFKVILPKKEKR